MLLFDTSILIELERELAENRVGPVRAYLGRHKAEDLACSMITVGELATGMNEVATRVLLRNLRKIPISEAVAYRAAELDRKQLSMGLRLGENDTWIAATAQHYSATLVYSAGDFERVDSLKRERPGSNIQRP
jgi:predicted nucleic acid-binding protein